MACAKINFILPSPLFYLSLSLSFCHSFISVSTVPDSAKPSPPPPPPHQPVCALSQQQYWWQWQAHTLRQPTAAASSSSLPTPRGAPSFPSTRTQAATEAGSTSAHWKYSSRAASVCQPFISALLLPNPPRSASPPWCTQGGLLSQGAAQETLNAQSWWSVLWFCYVILQEGRRAGCGRG